MIPAAALYLRTPAIGPAIDPRQIAFAALQTPSPLDRMLPKLVAIKFHRSNGAVQFAEHRVDA
jgi:hypothetical protein